MCGIAGAYSKQNIPFQIVEQMVNALSHRGPDAAGYFQSELFSGGMRRLSINDIEGADQPLYNADRSVVLFYNGEIYNSPQLRSFLEQKGYTFRTNGDGEVICHLFDVFGPQAFDKLDGMFAIALWSEKERALYLARDLAGEKPLYYARGKDGSLVFSSELRSFKFAPQIDLSLNKQAIWDFPTFLWIPEPATIYEQVFALRRGHCLKCDGSSLRINRLKNPFEGSFEGEEITKHLIRDVVERSISSRLLSDVPIGCFLSGGLDSSIVTKIASEHLSNVSTFSVGFEDLNDPYHGRLNEADAAREFSQSLGTSHYEITTSHKSFKKLLPEFCNFGDQPFAVSSGLGILAISKKARSLNVPVLLSGDGADELFGGYSWYMHLQQLRNSNTPNRSSTQPLTSMQNVMLPKHKVLEALSEYTAPEKAWALHYYAAEQEKAAIFNPEVFSECVSSIRYFHNFNSESAWTELDYIAHDRDFYLPNEMMRKLDRMSMAASVEARAPFVASEILELTNHLNISQMVDGKILKKSLRDAFDPILPEQIIHRPKHGFNVPIDHWLRHEWRDLVHSITSSNSPLNRLRLISPDADLVFSNMLKDQSRLNGHTIFCYVMLNSWLETQGY